jgi:hypothetical protein
MYEENKLDERPRLPIRTASGHTSLTRKIALRSLERVLAGLDNVHDTGPTKCELASKGFMATAEYVLQSELEAIRPVDYGVDDPPIGKRSGTLRIEYF